jgi:FMN phosphatase YigB (HAD superfamily)
MKSGKLFIISKAELGNNSQNGEGLNDVCLTPSTYAMTRPVFLIRNPIRVFDSWKNAGWTDEQNLIDCYTNMFRILYQAPLHPVSCLLYEHLIQNPHTEVKRTCAWWGVPFSEKMLSFKQPFGSSFIFSTDREKEIYLEKKPLGLFTTVEASSSVEIDGPYYGLLSNIEKDHIEEQLGRLYIQCWQDDILRLRAILREKIWFGFDLDDTLHEFRRSSGTATNKVLEEISERYGTPIPALKDQYSKVLKEKTANAFSDGKTSFDYWRERLTSVLAHLSLRQDDQFMAELLGSYEATPMASLELKCGALGILSTARNMGKKIVIMTGGPQDAQERTVLGHGVGGCIDFLATTNRFQVTKTNGLFPKVLEHLGISPGDMAYFGDNAQRDMKPAMAEGIFSIHLAQTKHVSLNSFPPQINTLRKLQYILSNESP